MRKELILLGLTLMIAGCDRRHPVRDHRDMIDGRWQILQQPDAAAVWRLDTRSGSLSYCHADFANRLVLCMPPAVPPPDTVPGTAPAGTQPATAAPYATQPAPAAPPYNGQGQPSQ